MNSKQAAKLAFGNPGFLDFLKPLTNLISSNIGLVTQVAKSNINPTYSGIVNPLLGLGRAAASQASSAPIVGSIAQPFADLYTEASDEAESMEDDGTGPNAIDDADDQDEGI